MVNGFRSEYYSSHFPLSTVKKTTFSVEKQALMSRAYTKYMIFYHVFVKKEAS